MLSTADICFRERIFPSKMTEQSGFPRGQGSFLVLSLLQFKKKSIKICVKQLLWDNGFGSSPAQIHSSIWGFWHAESSCRSHNTIIPFSSKVFKDVFWCFDECRQFQHVLKQFSEPNLQGCNLQACPFPLMTGPSDFKGLWEESWALRQQLW